MRNLFLTKVMKFFSYVSSRSCTVLGFAFRSAIHFGFSRTDRLRHGFEVLHRTQECWKWELREYKDFFVFLISCLKKKITTMQYGVKHGSRSKIVTTIVGSLGAG